MAHILTSPFGSGPTARATFAKLSWVWWCTAMSPQYFGCLWKEFIYIPEWLQTFWILTLPILNYIIPLVGVSYHCYLIFISHFFRELRSKKTFSVLPAVIVLSWDGVKIVHSQSGTYCGQITGETSCPPDESNICWDGYDEESTVYILSVPMTIALAVSLIELSPF